MLRYNLSLAMAIGLLACVPPSGSSLAGPLRAAEAAPGVVASIKPVHSLVAAVMAGVGEPLLLVGGNASPHAYTLRPSDARALERAALVFYVGPSLERFLVKSLAALAGRARVVALQEAGGLTLLAAGPAGLHAPEQGAAPAAAHRDRDPPPPHGEDGPGAAINPHLWLDPRNARAMVRAIAAALAQADPAHGAAYRVNAARLTADLAALEEELAARLAPVRDRPFLVFHDAYPYFERRFGLNSLGEITTTPEQAPGARRILEVRARLRAAGAVCVFSEPSFQPRLLETVTAGSRARMGVLDPIGAELPPGPALYFTLLRNLAAALEDCLSGGGKAP